MTAVLELGRLVYRSIAASGYCYGGFIQIESGGNGETVNFGPIVSGGTDQLTHSGFEFDGQVLLTMYRGVPRDAISESVLDHVLVGKVTLDEATAQPPSQTSVESWPWLAMRDSAHHFTLVYRITGQARNRRTRSSLRYTGTQQCTLETNMWNCVRPRENMLLFAPKYSKRQLKYVAELGPRNSRGVRAPRRWVKDPNSGDLRVTDPALRAAYRRAGEQQAFQHPENRSACMFRRIHYGEGDHSGERFIDLFYRVGGRVLGVKDWGDAANEFIPSMNSFGDYWGVPEQQRQEIDNGIDLDLALGFSHQGEGDAKTYDERLSQIIPTFEPDGFSPSEATDYGAVFPNFARDLALGHQDPLSAVVFFCHGWTTGFQLGLTGTFVRNRRARRQVAQETKMRRLANWIKFTSREDVVVMFYACSTGGKPKGGTSNADSFAGRLRDMIASGTNARRYCRVIGHAGAGHAVRYPRNEFFEGTAVGQPGIRLAPREILVPTNVEIARSRRQRRSAQITMEEQLQNYLSRRRARRARRGTRTHQSFSGFRWEFPFMSVEAVRAFLQDAEPPEGAFDEASGAHATAEDEADEEMDAATEFGEPELAD